MLGSAPPGRPWPAAGATRLRWEPARARWYDRASESDIGAEYEATVPAAIAEAALSLEAPLAARLDAATAALRRFDHELGAELAPFAGLLLRSESASSSQIEALTASARAILTAEIGEGRRANAELIVRNTNAMLVALEQTAADETAVLAMHAALLAGDERHPAGAWREEPVWIGTSARSPIGAADVAPPSGLVPGCMADLAAFAARGDLPPLAKAAIAYAQLETIHPFTDGNGRTGRALLQTLLRLDGVLAHGTAPISAGLLRDVDGHFAALDAYRRGELAPLLDRIATAAVDAVELGRSLVAELRAIREEAVGAVTARRDSAAWAVLELAMRRPVLTAAMIARELNRPARNVYRSLEPLLAAGVLVESAGEVSRTRIYRAPAVLEALDRFAERAGRRATPSGG